MVNQLRVRCVECDNKFLIVRSTDIPPAKLEKTFKCWCPYCKKTVWGKLEEEKEEETQI